MKRSLCVVLLMSGCGSVGASMQAGLPVVLQRSDSGVRDSGVRDSGVVTTQPDAGSPDDAGTRDAGLQPDAGELCGLPNPVAHVVLTADDGWPVNWPTCSTTSGACRQLFARRFSDQPSLDAFFTQELQAAAPNVGFFGAEALVVYDCGCPTRGATLSIDAISADSCSTVVSTTLTRASEESCVVESTFSRVYAVARLPADAGAMLVISNTDRVDPCGP